MHEIACDGQHLVLTRFASEANRALFNATRAGLDDGARSGALVPRLVCDDPRELELVTEHVGKPIIDSPVALPSAAAQLKRFNDIGAARERVTVPLYIESAATMLARLEEFSGLAREYALLVDALNDASLRWGCGAGVLDPSATNFCGRGRAAFLVDFDHYRNAHVSFSYELGFLVASWLHERHEVMHSDWSGLRTVTQLLPPQFHPTCRAEILGVHLGFLSLLSTFVLDIKVTPGPACRRIRAHLSAFHEVLAALRLLLE